MAPRGWNDPRRDKLWLYNLHYFDDLNAVDADARAGWHRALIPRWIAENPPGQGNGWEPYPTSLRIVNWVKWALRQGAPPGEADSALVGRPPEDPPAARKRADGHPVLLRESAGFRHSLAVQARWLRRRLEHHLLGNHLFANAKALVFTRAFFRGAEAEHWLALGQRLLARELREQILADGGHFERSPTGHCARWRLTGGEVELESGFWHPEFGRSVSNRCLVLRLAGSTGSFELAWASAGCRGETI
ncbi:heparinase II/III family protein [Thioalkalivibrio nitratireducens]